MRPVLIEVLDAREGIEIIRKVKPDFYNLLLPAEQSKSLKIVKLSYFFGEKILNQGGLVLPSGVESTTLQELNIDYCSVPLALVVNKSCEVFLGNQDRIMPLNLITEGNMFGVFEILSWHFGEPKTALWNVTAGSRSAFTLPSIGDRIAHRRLQAKYGFLEEPPKTILEQSGIFAAINRSSLQPWNAEILIFTKDWFSEKSIHESLINYLFSIGWKQSQRIRDQAVLDYLDEIFGYIMKKRRVIIPPLLLDKIQQLIMIGDKGLPGFAPAQDSSAFPLVQIQKAYLNDYQLKHYAPVIMQPKFVDKNSPAYYFLSYPYFSNFFKGSVKSFLAELKFIQKNLHLLLNEFKKTSSSKIFANLENITYQYFHHEAIDSENILTPDIIPLQDPNWDIALCGQQFPVNSSVFNGCVKISAR